jgi:hypothetical protein
MLQCQNLSRKVWVVRVKSKWNLKDRERTLSETGAAMGFILWRIAQQGVLNLENEGFQTDTNAQRLDVSTGSRSSGC